MLLDDALRERETNPRPAGLGGVEELEDAREHVRRDGGAAVVERATPAPARNGRRAERELARRRGSLRRVREHAVKRLCDLRGVERELHRRLGARALEGE